MTVTIRADRYVPLQTAPELAGIQSEVFDELEPMPPAGYFEVITGPARRATAAGRPLSIQPALVERLLADGAQGADALPLLALTLQQLYHDFGADGELSVADYEAMGGMATVVQTETRCSGLPVRWWTRPARYRVPPRARRPCRTIPLHGPGMV